MLDEAAQATNEEASPAAGGRKRMVMLGVLAGVMAVEGLVVFVLVKHFSASASPSEAQAASQNGLVSTEGHKAEPDLELKIGEFRIQNRKGQQAYTLDFTVFATIPTRQDAQAAGSGGGPGAAEGRPEDAVVAAKAAKIKDRFSRVVRAMDPERFAEPDLASLRSKLKEELGEVLGADVKIKEVLLTDFSCTPEN
ncbi:MAG: hypothetical protein HY718_15285 [Planctomycetes bacterium]|nr:hypothetical protein [Planctomycetota bacterium]